MAKLKTLTDALLNELKDLYSAENQLVKALPKMAKKASSDRLKMAILGHLKETETQVARLEKIAKSMGEKLSGKTCKAMKGLVEEGKEILEEKSVNAALIDALLIGACRRVEHYEIAAYGTARAMARAVGEEKVAALLGETLDEELAADEKLTAIAEEEVLAGAQTGVQEVAAEKKTKNPNVKKSSKAGTTKQAMMRGVTGFGVGLLFATLGSTAHADTRSERTTNEREAAQHEVDNSGVNARDGNPNRKTADDQGLGGDHVELLARIRRAIVSNDKLSVYAKNVKIVVDDRSVTLRGPVNTPEEKAWIAGTTAKLAPKLELVNQLEVASN